MDDDIGRIRRYANRLEIAELELFRLAWKQWYGTRATDEQIEAHFLPYMFDGEVPCWVRNFCADIARNPARIKQFRRPSQRAKPRVMPWDEAVEINKLVA